MVSSTFKALQFDGRANSQIACPLFSVLPSELRFQILELCLSETEDTSRPFKKDRLWTRPSDSAPWIIETSVLRTCKLIYREVWFLPWTGREHTIYLAARDRRPMTSMNPFLLEERLQALHAAHGDIPQNHLRIFSQLYLLEDGKAFQDIMNIKHFFPKTVTVIIRHTDFWNWEVDDPLKVDGEWAHVCRLPNSVTTLRVEFESLLRKKEQVDHIASEAAERWVFRRKDDRKLVSSAATTTTATWTGCSMLNTRRWIRDESRPNELDYHVATLTWRLEPHSTLPTTADRGEIQNITVPDAPVIIADDRWTFINSWQLSEAGVTMSMSADEAVAAVQARTVYAMDTDSEQGYDETEEENGVTDDEAEGSTDEAEGANDEAAMTQAVHDDEILPQQTQAVDESISWASIDPLSLHYTTRHKWLLLEPLNDHRFGGAATRYKPEYCEQKMDEWKARRDADIDSIEPPPYRSREYSEL